jgi:hypothetical protein
VSEEPDQSYYWTEEWQEGERAADAEIAAGELERFDDVDAALEWLRTPAEPSHD